MARALREHWGNPSSVHAEGAAARAAVERARERVAALLGVPPRGVVFTSGASEANNTMVSRVAGGAPAPGRQLVSSNVEHPSVEAPLAAREAEGFRVTRVAVDADGRLEPDAVAAALAPDTALLTLLYAHNETG